MYQTYFKLLSHFQKSVFFQGIYFIINTLRVTNPLFIQLIKHYQKINS